MGLQGMVKHACFAFQSAYCLKYMMSKHTLFCFKDDKFPGQPHIEYNVSWCTVAAATDGTARADFTLGGLCALSFSGCSVLLTLLQNHCSIVRQLNLDDVPVRPQDVGQNNIELWNFKTGGGWIHPIHVHLVVSA